MKADILFVLFSDRMGSISLLTVNACYQIGVIQEAKEVRGDRLGALFVF